MSFSIEKLMYWRAGKWAKLDQGSNAVLQIHCNQLVIINKNKVLESLNMHGKIKGFYKGDVLILVVSASDGELRKMKFKVSGNINKCLEALGKHFPVISYGSGQNESIFISKYKNVEEVMKCALETMERQEINSLQVPENYTNFVKLCLLDPAFPQFVQETQNILHNL